MTSLSKSSAWQALSTHYQTLSKEHMRDWFDQDPERSNRYRLKTCGLSLDYSRNRINQDTLSLLIELANSSQLAAKIQLLFKGAPINVSERRPALHTALRDHHNTPIMVEGENIKSPIAQTKLKMRQISNDIHQKQWVGVTGKPITHIVNIGIGGSYLGPQMTIHALKDFAVTPLSFHFISTVDDVQVNDVWHEITPEQTLFIISSKSFTTIETMTNAKTILERMKAQFGENVIHHHFIAITAATEKAQKFGIPDAHILPLWEWVGGRYSIWSAIGLPLMLSIGADHFDAFLKGANEMDIHFQSTNFAENMPVLLALLEIWYINFFHASAHALAPYAYRLRYLVPYLQQAAMESNGKCISIDGTALDYTTSPIIFGEEGCNGQHTYHQLLHQGNRFIPVDLILIHSKKQNIHQSILRASGESQAEALMLGKTYEEGLQELLAKNYSMEEASVLAHHKKLSGNRPSNILSLDDLTPYHLGALIALYEHKIYTESVIWNINCFDQWGVELGKQLLPNFLQGKANEA